MQVPDEAKREKILAVASELFATRQFHKVLLSEVAAQAGVGKGTLYVYFRSKEELHLGVLQYGFAQLVARLRACLGTDKHPPAEAIAIVVRELVGFAWQHPSLFELLRTVSQQVERSRWDKVRHELTELVAAIIRQGNRQGVFFDPEPDLTAQFIPGLVRSAMISRSEVPSELTLPIESHIVHFVLTALTHSNPALQSR